MTQPGRYFTPGIDTYFNDWIRSESWDSGHRNDTRQFHLFLFALHNKSRLVGPKRDRRHRRTSDREIIKMTIMRAVKDNHPRYADEVVAQLAEEFTEEAMPLLEFLWNTHFYPSHNVHDW